MNEQLWGLGGVVAGIAGTTVCNWWLERSKHNREHSTLDRKENLKRCEALLASVESYANELRAYLDDHGILPRLGTGIIGIDTPRGPSGRDKLTDIHIHCPAKVYAAAALLVDALEAWGWRHGEESEYGASRVRFIEAIRKHM
jgi:hypothetical protein